MKVMAIGSAAIVVLLLATATPANSQQERREEGKDHPEQQRGKPEQARPEAQHQQGQRPEGARPQQGQRAQAQQHAAPPQPHAAPAPQHHEQSPQEHAQQRPVPRPPQQAQQHRQSSPPAQHARTQPVHRPAPRTEQERVRRSAWQQHGSQHWETDHRTWQQRGGYHGYRIPEERYRGYFGPSHGFRIHGLPFLVVGGYPRFRYQGYWISAVDPWPAYWGDDWYDNDDVYVNYVDNGYYLYNRRYPSVGIAINISM